MTNKNAPFFELLKKENLPFDLRELEIAKVLGTFDSRDLLVSAVGNVSFKEGDIYSDGLVDYVYEEGASVISDLPNLKPSGPVQPEHFGAKGDGTTDDSTALNNWATALQTTESNGLARSVTYSCEGVTISGLAAGTVIDFNGATFKQITSDAIVLTLDIRDCHLSNLRVDNHDGADSSEVLILAQDCWKNKFTKIVTEDGGTRGTWKISTNGDGGYYWNKHVLCEAQWLIDPSVTGDYGAFASSVNANTWESGVCAGLQIVAPTLTPGNFQQAYGLVFNNMDMVSPGPFVNNYNDGIGTGTDDFCVPLFRDCTWEYDGQFQGRCRASYNHIAGFSDGFPFDQNYPDQSLEVGTSNHAKYGAFQPKSSPIILSPNMGVSSKLEADFNGTWEIDTDTSAPFGDKHFKWTKSSGVQGTPKIVLPKEILRQAAYFGGISVGFFVKAVTGVAGFVGYKQPAIQSSSFTSLTSAYGVTDSDDSEGWVYRFGTLKVDPSLKNTSDDIGILLSQIDTSIASEYLFGPIEITVGTCSSAASSTVEKSSYTKIDAVADGSTWQTAFTVSLPSRDSASYRLVCKTVGAGGRATSSELISEVVVSRYDATVSGTVSVTKDGTVADGVVDDVRVSTSGTDALVQVQLSLWTGSPTFEVDCYLIPNIPDYVDYVS